MKGADSALAELNISQPRLGSKHPDPCGHQLKVLQAALSNILSGISQVSLPIVLLSLQ